MAQPTSHHSTNKISSTSNDLVQEVGGGGCWEKDDVTIMLHLLHSCTLMFAFLQIQNTHHA